jgi:hypothetical protein
MNHFFQPGSFWYPFRWFIVFLATLTMGMTYVDYTGWRFMSFSGSGAQQQGYYGSPMYHK